MRRLPRAVGPVVAGGPGQCRRRGHALHGGDRAKNLALALRAASVDGQGRACPSARARVDGLIVECVDRSFEFTPQGLAVTCSALSRLRGSAADEALITLAAAAAVALEEHPEIINEQDVSNIASAMARSRQHHASLFRRVSLFLERRAPLTGFFTGQGLANTLNAYAVLGIDIAARPLQVALEDTAAEFAPVLSAANLANTLNSLARLQLGGALSRHPGRWSMAVRGRMPEFLVQGLSNVLNAYARLQAADPELFGAVAERLESCRPEAYGEQEAANVLNACARLGFDSEPLVRFLERDVLARLLPAFTSQGLANTALALGRLPHSRHASERLMQECFRRVASTGRSGGWAEPHHMINTMFAFALFGLRSPSATAGRYGSLITSMLRALPVLVGLQRRVSPEAMSQLYAVLVDLVVVQRRDRTRARWPFRDLQAYAQALELCDPEMLLKGMSKDNMLMSPFHEEVAAVSAPLHPPAALVVNEAFVAPYIVDLLVMPTPPSGGPVTSLL